MPKSIQGFIQHGFVPEGESGDHVHGTCPLCLREKHFYINQKTNNWDCKHCSESGGFKDFLKKVVYFCYKGLFVEKNELLIKKLSNNRGLKTKTLQRHRIGYNYITQTYTLPMVNTEGNLYNIGLYKINDKILSTSGCNLGLFGWGNYNTDHDTIWLCEGQWDAMALEEAQIRLGIKNEIVMSVPGANIFKDEWFIYFKDKNVNVLFDNDKTGKDGSIKVYNKLKTLCKDLKFIRWSDSYPKGWDIRDLYKEKELKIFRSIKSSLYSFPVGMDIEDTTSQQIIRYKGKGIPAKKVYKFFEKWLKFPDDNTDVLDVLFGATIANRLEGDPIWLFLVAPSGGMKTELLMSMHKAPGIFTTTSLTPQSLLSGWNMGGGDPSLIPKLNNKVLVIKDFTTILDMNPVSRTEIFGVLRDAYDGMTEKVFGTGDIRSYRSKFGLVAGVTPAIELYTEEHTALGERFINYRIPIKSDAQSRREILIKAVENVTKEDKMKKELVNISTRILDCLYSNTPRIPRSIISKILSLAEWTAIMRSTIIRDKYTKEITHKPYTELGTRLAKQYSKLLLGIGMFRRLSIITWNEYNIVKKVARDTIPSRLEDIVRYIYHTNSTASYSVIELSNVLRFPQITTTRLIDNLTMLRVLDKNRTGLKSEWVLSDNFIKLIEGSQVYSGSIKRRK